VLGRIFCQHAAPGRVAWVLAQECKSCRFETMKTKKPREEKYDTKLAINGTFAVVIKASVIPMPTDKKVIPKKDKPKKK